MFLIKKTLFNGGNIIVYYQILAYIYIYIYIYIYKAATI